MAKPKFQADEAVETVPIYKLTGGIQDKLRGAGYQEQWTNKPKGQPFVLSCWMSPARRFVVVQQYNGGLTLLFEEVSEASFWSESDGAA